MIKNKTILVGVTGGIAAYKTCEIVSHLVKLGADVWVVMTKEAAAFVAPLTFRTLSNNPVITSLFDPALLSLPVPHIAVADKADLILIAPCTANIIGKLAGGIADDALTTIVMASTAKKILAPAMNANMWRNPVVLENVEKLKKLGFEMIGPCEGRLACGVEDIGRMAEPGEIVGIVRDRVRERNEGEMKGKKVLVTAGGTREAIDPVRYISNRSSGKMGYAIAEAARDRGAEVTLISAPTNLSAPSDVKVVKVESAAEMLDAVLQNYAKADVVVMAAAVADFRPRQVSNGKIKKVESRQSKIENRKRISKRRTPNPELNIALTQTEDILKTLAQRKDRKGKIHVGFALETEDLVKNAKQKLKDKDLDFIVANSPETFEGDEIAFQLIDKKGKVVKFLKQTKEQAASVLLNSLA